MSIPEIQQSIIDEFSCYSDWFEKYAYIIELGQECPLIDEKEKTPENLIQGCQSNVWLSCTHRDGRLFFKADSDAVITKGIIAILIRVFDGQPPKDIIAADLGFIDAIGLTAHLSPTRSNGLASMVKQIKYYALAHAND